MASLPPQRERQLAVMPHSDSVTLIVRENGDLSRIEIEVWTLHSNSWRLGGFGPGFAAVLLDDVAAALLLARDVRGRR
jgi:hypothetical protein